MLRIAIVEQSDLVRNGLERILSRRPEIEVVLSVESPDRLLQVDHAALAGLGVIILGPSRQRGGSPYPTIGALAEFARILVVAEPAERDKFTGVIRVGAFGWVSRHVTEDELTWAVHTVAQGGIHVSPALSPLLRSELQGRGAIGSVPLAPRESETLGWIAEGLTHRQIARHMGLTEATVATYVRRIRTKLRVGNKADLTRAAIELGLVERTGGRLADVRGGR